MFIPINTWIAGKDLTKHHYQTKKDFYSKLNKEDITDKEYEHYQKVQEQFDLEILGDYHDLYVQSNTLLLSDVFENFRNKCIEIYELDPAHFLSAPGLAWPAYLNKTGAKLDLLTDVNMLLMVEKRIRGGICEAIHRYARANNKYMKSYDKNIKSSQLMYLDANNLYEWPMSQKPPANGFEWVEDLSQFKENFIKNYEKNSNKGYFLEVHVEYSKKLFNSEREKIGKCKKLICNIRVKENYVVLTRALKRALNHGLILKT